MSTTKRLGNGEIVRVLRDENLYSTITIDTRVHAAVLFSGNESWQRRSRHSLCGVSLVADRREAKSTLIYGEGPSGSPRDISTVTCDVCKILAAFVLANKIKVTTNDPQTFRKFVRTAIEASE